MGPPEGSTTQTQIREEDDQAPWEAAAYASWHQTTTSQAQNPDERVSLGRPRYPSKRRIVESKLHEPLHTTARTTRFFGRICVREFVCWAEEKALATQAGFELASWR
jgi:hypothetical protein